MYKPAGAKGGSVTALPPSFASFAAFAPRSRPARASFRLQGDKKAPHPASFRHVSLNGSVCGAALSLKHALRVTKSTA
jgi:hypothetical protein